MDEKFILEKVLEAHQLLRHDFMNNLQVISGYQQIGHPEKANEYIYKTVNFLRRFSALGKLDYLLLKGLLVFYLTKFEDDAVFRVKVEGNPPLPVQEEDKLAAFLREIMKLAEEDLKKETASCRIVIGTGPELLAVELEGLKHTLAEARERLEPLLGDSLLCTEMQQKGNTIQVMVYTAGTESIEG